MRAEDLRAAELKVDLKLECSEPGVEYRALWALELGRAEAKAPITDEGQSIGNSTRTNRPP